MFLTSKKQKFSINLRADNDWTKDSSKLGQKMLEKMGWKSGKGLGKNENGIVDPVKARFKNDSQGLGFKEIAGGSTQQDNFNSFLENLNKTIVGETVDPSISDVSEVSLEKKSENSRVRVHYRKVTRGKDVSQYSAKDLANIFSKKKFNCDEETNKVEDEIFGGYSDSYFKNKLESRKLAKQSHNVSDESMEKDEESKSSFISYLHSNANEVISKKKRKKLKECSDNSVASPLKKIKTEEVNDNNQSNGIINPNFELSSNQVKEEILDVNADLTKKQKKKLKRHLENSVTSSFVKVKTKQNDTQSSGIVNPGFEPLGTHITVKKEILNSIEEDLEESTATNDEPSTNMEEIQEENPYEIKVSKKKKKKNKKLLSNEQINDLVQDDISVGIDNPILNLNETDENLITDKSHEFEVKRKKPKKSSKLGVDNAALNLSNANLSLQSIENIETSINGIQNPGFTDFVLKSVLTPQGSNKLKRNKSVRFSETNEEFLIPNRITQLAEEQNEIDGVENLNGIDNNGFEINIIQDSTICNGQVKAATISKHICGIDNIAYDAKNQTVEEAIISLTDTIDQYQAEVENGINESKAKKRKRKSFENTNDSVLD